MSDKWRTGTQIPLNVYAGNRPVCQCHSVCDAKTIVDAVNKIQELGLAAGDVSMNTLASPE